MNSYIFSPAQAAETQQALNAYERSTLQLGNAFRVLLAMLVGILFIAGVWLLALLCVIVLQQRA
jgi:hypothetical protein